MIEVAQFSPAQKESLREELRLLDVFEDAKSDPKALINEIKYFDPVTLDWIKFTMYPPEEWENPIQRVPRPYGMDLRFISSEGAFDWYWQSVFIDWLHNPKIHAYLVYKARQLGITLLAVAYALWLMLFRPGTNIAGYSYEETEAHKLVQAAWDMLIRLPPALTKHVTVTSPSKGAIPTEWLRLKHEDGRYSTFQGLPATGLHGHGGRITFSIQDELARQRYGRLIHEAITPAVLSRGGKWLGVSTAFGVSNPETGEGNFFHHLFATREEKGLSYVFLPWNAEPTRKGTWYDDVAMKLPVVERNRQYPLNEEDGFMLSGATYFDPDVLAYYRANVKSPLRKGQFVPKGVLKAKFQDIPAGMVELYELPKEGAGYVLAVDTSTGRADDYTSADVLDLASGALVAHLHARVESPRAAFQIHYLGKLYNEALIGVERGGGYGESLIIALRDGTAQLPAYRKLYRHRKKTKPGARITDEFGFPMNQATRPLVLEKLKNALYERRAPWVSHDHLYELGTFVHKDTAPTPRAEDGCNDDCVMSLAIGNFMYETYGATPTKELRKKDKRKQEYTPGPARAGR